MGHSDRFFHQIIIIIMVLVGGGLTAKFTTNAQAIALYDAYAKSELKIIDFFDPDTLESIEKPFDLAISGDASLFDSSAKMTGNASASLLSNIFVNAVDPASLQIDEGTFQEAQASGDASTPSDPSDILSGAASRLRTDGSINMVNNSTDFSIGILFEFSYNYDVSVSSDDPLNEFARAKIRIALSIDCGCTVLVDISQSIDSNTGGTLKESNSMTFILVLNPGESEGLFVINDAAGTAVSYSLIDTPEPSTIALLSTGCVGLFTYHLYRRKRA